jgi:ATP-dependent helicase/nuclease subunit B
MSEMGQQFFGWDESALKLAVDFLCADFSGGTLDLSRLMLVLPTRHASRRLREALAARVAEKGGAVLPGAVVTPDDLVRAEGALGPVEELTYWVKLLEQIDPAVLLPLLPAGRDTTFSARVSLSEKIVQLRRLLCDEHCTIAEVIERFEHNPESSRWDSLKQLEWFYLQMHAQLETVDGCAARMARSENPEVPAGIEKVLLLFVPDLTPLTARAVQNLAEKVPVEICVRAPESDRAGFTELGQPVAAYWGGVHLPLENEQLVQAVSPFELAEIIQERVERSSDAQRADMAIGVPDSELLPLVRSGLREAGIATFDPSGESLAVHGLYHLVERVGRLMETRSFDAFAQLVRHPHYLDFLSADAALLKELDRYQQQHLPLDFGLLSDQSSVLRDAAKRTSELLALFKDKPLSVALPAALQQIYGDKSAAKKEFADAAARVMELLEPFAVLEKQLQPKSSEAVSLFLRLLKSMRLYEPRQQTALDLLGWAELAWEDASVLLLAGMHDGSVPESVTGDLFLPDSARTQLGLRDNHYLLGRDIYLMRSLLASRADGQCVCYISRTNRSGDPQKPSRLLFQCAADELAARALNLFGECAPRREKAASSIGWALRPPVMEHKPKVSVTSFKEYLDCPFRYYLKRVLKMGDVIEPRKQEMDARDFGNVVHHALEQFALNGPKTSEDLAEISDFVLNAADVEMRALYGATRSAALIIQQDVIHQRLKKFAEVQAKLSADGWQIEEAELRIEDHRMFPGIQLTGIIDRIDRHADGRVRVIDYKTFDSNYQPVPRHLRSAKEGAPEWSITAEGKQWTDLQLPLYSVLMRERYGRDVECGYFVLPKAISETGIYLWDDLTDLLPSAETCARAIVEGIKTNTFWPPAQKVKYDDFESLFAGDLKFAEL